MAYLKLTFDDQDYKNFGIFMYLFNVIDSSHSKVLALLALDNADEDVRKLSEIYFQKIRKDE